MRFLVDGLMRIRTPGTAPRPSESPDRPCGPPWHSPERILYSGPCGSAHRTGTCVPARGTFAFSAPGCQVRCRQRAVLDDNAILPGPSCLASPACVIKCPTVNALTEHPRQGQTTSPGRVFGARCQRRAGPAWRWASSSSMVRIAQAEEGARHGRNSRIPAGRQGAVS